MKLLRCVALPALGHLGAAAAAGLGQQSAFGCVCTVLQRFSLVS